MAGQNSRHRGARPSRSTEHPHHPDAVSASMGRSCSSHGRPPAGYPRDSSMVRRNKESVPTEVRRKRFKNTIKTSLKAFKNINPDTCQQTAMDRARWRYSIHKGARLCEERRTAAAAQQKGLSRKSPRQQSRAGLPTLPVQGVTANSVHASA